jgi:hypothetical protein
MVDKVEALVDAIARLNNSHDPESIAYRLRNPLLLRSFSKPGKHEVDETGRRVFGSYLNGYKAAVYDVKMKLSGSSHAGISQKDTLKNLLAVYGIKELGGVDQIVKFLRRALKDTAISPQVGLLYFDSKEAV